MYILLTGHHPFYKKGDTNKVFLEKLMTEAEGIVAMTIEREAKILEAVKSKIK